MNYYIISIGASIDCEIDGKLRQFDIDEEVKQYGSDPMHAMGLAIQVAIQRWPEGQLHSALVVRQYEVDTLLRESFPLDDLRG